jgi:hypothetical protein
MRRGAMACAALLAAILAGCGGVISAADAGPAPFPECEADAYAFVADTSLAAIGLGEWAPEEAGRVGRIFVTAGPPDPARWPGPPGAPLIQQRIACLEFPDGSGMSGPIPDDWSPPMAGLALPAEAGSPIALAAVVVALALVVGVSLLAFGWRPGGHGSR